MSKKSFLLPILLSVFNLVNSTYAGEYNKLQSSILNKSNTAGSPSFSKTYGTGHLILSGFAGAVVGATAGTIVANKTDSEELKKAINESNDWKSKYEEKSKENEQLKEQNVKLKKQIDSYKNKNIYESPSDLNPYYNVGKILYDFLDNGKKTGRGEPLDYLDSVLNRMSGGGDKYLVLDPNNEDESDSNCAIFKRIINGDNILANFSSLPEKFQELFITVAIKNMAAIQATQAANVMSMLGAPTHFDFKNYYPYFEQCQKIAKA